MLGMPSPSSYDLKFRAFGFPVRVTPWFWLGTLMIGATGDLKNALIWVGCVFASILIHELGHAFAARRFGHRAEIVLVALGGLTRSEGKPMSPRQRFLMLAAGPGAQFVLLGAIVLIAWASFGLWPSGSWDIAQRLLGFEPDTSQPVAFNLGGSLDRAGEFNFSLYFYLLQINWIWPLLNLLPLWPLDGGQMTQVILTRVNPRRGTRWTHVIGMLVAGVIAAYVGLQLREDGGGSMRGGGLFRVIFFGWFALMNYHMLQALHDRYLVTGADEEEDWWRR